MSKDADDVFSQSKGSLPEMFRTVLAGCREGVRLTPGFPVHAPPLISAMPTVIYLCGLSRFFNSNAFILKRTLHDNKCTKLAISRS